MEELKEIEIVRLNSEWLKEAPALDVMRKEKVVKEYTKHPSLSVQAEHVVAIKCLSDSPREVEGEDQNYAFIDAELVEPAIVYTKEKGEYEAEKGTMVSMNLKRHASLFRRFKDMFFKNNQWTCKDQEIAIGNLGKRTFKTDKAPRGKATGYDYRIMLLADLKAKMKKGK